MLPNIRYEVGSVTDDTVKINLMDASVKINQKWWEINWKWQVNLPIWTVWIDQNTAHGIIYQRQRAQGVFWTSQQFSSALGLGLWDEDDIRADVFFLQSYAVTMCFAFGFIIFHILVNTPYTKSGTRPTLYIIPIPCLWLSTLSTEKVGLQGMWFRFQAS